MKKLTFAGVLADLKDSPEFFASKRIFFVHLDKWAIARGAIIPQLQELSLVPLLGDSVFL